MEIIGIDFGTTYSCISYNSEIIVNELGNRITPSCVSFEPSDNSILVGEIAKECETNIIYGVKRLLGKKYSEINKKNYDYKISTNENDEIIINDKYTPIEITSYILAYLKKCSENYFGKEIKNAIITIPAYYNNSQRKATLEACKLAHLEVLQLLHEPTSAALANGVKNGVVLVFDLGGGTLDISVLDIDDKEKVFEVKGTLGDMNLGGEDIDNIIMNYVLSNINDSHVNLIELRKKSEEAKKKLSVLMITTIEINGYTITLSRQIFETLISEFIEKCIRLISELLEQIKINKNDLCDVVLIGGTTRIPLIREKLTEYFNKPLNILNNPDEAVSIGASIYSKNFNNSSDLLLLDAIPFSIGTETDDGKMIIIVPKGTLIPTKKEKVFTTSHIAQTTAKIKLYEGENILAKNNIFLGELKMDNLFNAKIKVIISIDKNGIIEVIGIDIDKKKSISIQLKNIEHVDNVGLNNLNIKK